jgi:NADH-quinone oxidoreductase subunit L
MHVTEAAYIGLIPLLPLLGALVLGLGGVSIQRAFGKRVAGGIAVATVAASFLLSVRAFLHLAGMEPDHRFLLANLLPWIHIGSTHVDLAYAVDPLSAIMILVITGIGGLIHLYATAYMEEDPAFWRFFMYLNLFTFAMLTLVLGDSLLTMFVGWEGVGLCSWGLIGFWHTTEANARAGNKAFIVNRVGDFGFILGIFLLFWTLDAQGQATVVFRELPAKAPLLAGQTFWGFDTVTVITLFLFVGAAGKSAQIPLYVWLPDAMAGPTPVSALIHAATMVTAGVYMCARLNFLFSMAPTTMAVIATIGACTALLAASIATAQNDIKKVLAYSTVSQLGYMFLATGVGAYAAAVFHLMTHAFFKACLFLGSGSVIHGMHHEQDMRKMGGLRAYMPTTFITFFIATLAIAGVPPFAGFFSKDEILWQTFSSPHGSKVWWLMGMVVAGTTAFYMFRQVFMVFFGEPHWQQAHAGGHGHDDGHDHGAGHGDAHGHHAPFVPHESPWQMTLPLQVLMVGSMFAGFLWIPHMWLPFEHWLEPVIASPHGGEHGAPAYGANVEFGLMGLSVAVASLGILLAYLMYYRRTIRPEFFTEAFGGSLYEAVLNKWYVDEIYQATIVNGTLALARAMAWFDRTIIDGMVNGAATVVRLISQVGGLIDTYLVDGAVNGVASATWMIGGQMRKLQTGTINAYVYVILAALLGGVALFFGFAQAH